MKTNVLNPIHQTQKSRKVREQPLIQPEAKVDRLSISPESRKIEQWVEMLKKMPDDVHLEQIETAHSVDIHANIADKLLSGRP